MFEFIYINCIGISLNVNDYSWWCLRSLWSEYILIVNVIQHNKDSVNATTTGKFVIQIRHVALMKRRFIASIYPPQVGKDISPTGAHHVPVGRRRDKPCLLPLLVAGK